MTAILTGVNDFDRALEMARATVYCSDVIFGKDSAESAKRHTQLASILYKNDMVHEALIHNMIAVHIYSSLNGVDSEYMHSMYLNLGMCLMQCGFIQEACDNMMLCLKYNDEKTEMYLNAAFYAVVLNTALKHTEDVEESKKCLDKALSDKDEDFKKAMMDNLHKQLKDLH